MRRTIILALLLASMQLILPLGARGHGGQWLLAFGFLVVAADVVGQLAQRFKLPALVGHLAAGVIFGPQVMGTVSVDAARQLQPVSALAISLIAFLAGAELRWEELRSRGPLLLRILAVEMPLVLVAVGATLLALQDYVPFLAGGEMKAVVAMATLFAAISVVHSPAVTMAILTESRANGPVAKTTLGVVLLSDVAVILLFALVLALVRAVVPPGEEAAASSSFLLVLWEITGALIVGAVLGGGVALYLRFVRRELFLFAILIAFFGAELARLTHVETLLTMLTAGFVAENVSDRAFGEALRHAMERSAAPVFVVFFALAGASLDLAAVATLWPLVLPLVIARGGALWLGARVGARWGGATALEQRYVWMGLVSQAGVAIGLATVAADAYPERGAEIRSLFLAMLAVNQTLGPILFKHALSRAGELSPQVSEPQLDTAHGTTPRTA